MAAESNGGCEVEEVLPRSGHIAVAAENYMIVWGGYQEDSFLGDRYLPPKELNVYHTEHNYWTSHSTRGDIPTGTSGATGFLIDGKLYVFAGHMKDGNTNCLYCLDLKTMHWTLLGPHEDEEEFWPSPRDKFTSWHFENKLYCFGGFGVPFKNYLHENGQFCPDMSTPWPSERGWNNQLIVYDLSTGRWKNPKCKGPIPSPRAAHASIRFDKTVYLFGGRHGDRRMNDLHMLDLGTLTWSGEVYTEGACPCGRSWHTMTASSKSVAFLYGGYSTNGAPLSDAWLLDISVIQWTQLTVPNDRPRLWHTSCCSMEGEILVFGGCCNDILDYSEQTIHSNEVLTFCLQPYKLQRLCLEAVFIYKSVTQTDWPLLPRQLKDWLEKKDAVTDKLKTYRQPDWKTSRTGSTCAVS